VIRRASLIARHSRVNSSIIVDVYERDPLYASKQVCKAAYPYQREAMQQPSEK
jgi:hypothetical protein